MIRLLVTKKASLAMTYLAPSQPMLDDRALSSMGGGHDDFQLPGKPQAGKADLSLTVEQGSSALAPR